MERLFRDCPEALANTLRVAEQCAFNLSTDLGYSLPEPNVPAGYTTESYLRRLCSEAAQRRYGTVSPQVEQRLEEEFRLIRRHRLAGFLLLYREIVLIAQEVMEEQGMTRPETPLEERLPGRGRGSSVALLVGYLVGISHVDPLRWDLTLERFIPEDMTMLPDIDLDFPRALRGRAHRAGAPALRSRVRRPRRGRLHLLGEGRHPGPGQGPGAAQGRSAAVLEAAPLPGRRPAAGGDVGPSRLPRPGGRAGLAGPRRAGSPADARAPESGAARRGHGSQRLPPLRDGPHPRRGHRRPLHHGLGQGQRGRRQLRQD